MKLDEWIPALHVVGAILWVGGLTAVLSLLHVHPRLEEGSRKLLVGIERRLALAMDLGATLTIVVGLYNAIKWDQFKNGGWLHIKLTVVVVCLLSVHGIARVKLKKFREGDVRPVPPVVWILLAAGTIVAVVLGANPTLLRR